MKFLSLIRRFYFLLDLIVFYIYDLVKSGLVIGLDVLTFKNLSSPRFLEYPIQANSNIEVTILANLISFSPGTIVVDLNEEKSSLTLHVMFSESDENIIKNIKEKLEFRVLRVLR